MVTHLVKLSPDATLEDAVEALLRTSQHEFPVVDSGERVLGVLTRDALIAALRRDGPTTPVANVMQRDLPVVQTDEPFDKAFHLMQQSAFPALPVVDRLGRLRGLITPENVGELMMVTSLLPKGGQPAWRAASSSSMQ
jgi:CBS domain-containing protein